MRIGKRATLEDIRRDTWADFAKEIGMAAPFVRRRVKELAAAARTTAGTAADALAAALDGSALRRYAGLVADRAERLALTV